VKIPGVAAATAINLRVIKEKIQTTQERKDESGGRENAGRSSDSDVKSSSDSTEISDGSAAEEDAKNIRRSRKRRRVHQGEDLESSYLNRLAQEEAKEELHRQVMRQFQIGRPGQRPEKVIESVTSRQDLSSASSEEEDINVPQHESISGLDASATLSKAARTVFLSNVSTAAIKAKSAKKVLLTHLASPLHALEKHDPLPKLESLRFRSTAFASGVGPKRAAFAKKELMEDTTASTNAYAVYSSEAAARIAASKLNGTIVLDRHLRADYAAQPAVIDHRRCVFVGNLSFVDREIVENPNVSEDRKPRRPKAKEPADAEEGLWRTFGRAGTVESVRVVRDRETRVGKGFAYVQFKHENGVEVALLYNNKKFPPMLPRKLRVMRAKRPKQAIAKRGRYPDSVDYKPNDRSGSSSSHGKQASLTARSSGGGRAAQLRKPNGFIFEGHRASISSGTKPGDAQSKKRRARKPSTRSSRRGAAFKAVGGKRKRESE
jgi:nucleolar protein 12